jgi:hypothetical protein
MLLQALHELGIYTMVDMHQDFYSRYLNIGCGEGFPECAQCQCFAIRMRVPMLSSESQQRVSC